MHTRTLDMGKLINEMDGNEEIKHSFIEVIKVMIMIDDNIHENEIKMFDSLCDLWNVQSELKL